MELKKVLFKTTLLIITSTLLFNFLHTFSATQCYSRIVPSQTLAGLTSIPRSNIQTFNTTYFQTKHIDLGIPLIVHNFTNHWPAMKLFQDIRYFGLKCSLNFTEKIYGMSIEEYTNYIQHIEQDTDPIDFSNMKHLGAFYFKHNEALFYDCPELWQDVNHFPTARAHASKPNTYLSLLARAFLSLFAVEFLPSDFIWGDWIQAVTWIGPPGSKTLLHYDDDPLSLLYQFKGSKTVRLYSPDQSKFLYPKDECIDLSEYGTRFSKFVGDPTSMTSMETLKYPMVKKAKHLDIDLDPGDMLYIPSGW